jgi:hypothetical protein
LISAPGEQCLACVDWDRAEDLQKLDFGLTAFIAVCEEPEREQVSLRDAAYLIAVDRTAGHAAREAGCDMNPYTLIGSGLGTAEAASLSQRLAAWHDAMVEHERRLRASRTDGRCDEDCAHSDARALWAEALTTFGDRAHELSFLRSRAMSPAVGLRLAQCR